MHETDNKDEISEELDDHVEWAEEKDHTVIYFAASEDRKFGPHFAMSAFLHVRGLESINQENCKLFKVL